MWNGRGLFRPQPRCLCGAGADWRLRPHHPLELADLAGRHEGRAAIAAGCTMVLKPSELAPLSSLILAEIIDAAGLPAGVLTW